MKKVKKVKKVKKGLIITFLIISMLAMVGFAPAESTYWEEMKKVYEWQGTEGDSEVDITINFPPDLNQNYKLNMYTKGDLQDFVSYMEIKVEDMDGEVSIPTIKLYTKSSDLYINTEAITPILELMGIAEELNIEEEYVALRNNTNPMDINSNVIKEMITFIENMDLGIDLGMIKEGNTYTLTLDSDKVIDLLDAYIRYIINNMDKFPEELIQPEIRPSEQEVAEALKMYEENIAIYKDMAKEFIKGSYYKSNTIIDKDQVKASTETFIKAPMGDVKITAISSSTKLDNPHIQLPTSVRVFTEEDLTELIITSTGYDNVEMTNMKLKATIDRDGNYTKFGEVDIEEGKLELEVNKGRAYITAEEATKLLDTELGKEGFIAIKSLEDYGLHIYWDAENKIIDIYEIQEK